MKLRVSDNQYGFTILEVLFAVVILAAATLPILGLQSAALDRVYQNEREQQATLIARQMLSFIEGDEKSLGTSRAQKPASQLLRELAAGAKGVDYAPVNVDILEDYQALFIVEPWSIEMLGETELLRITLEVSWGEGPRDRVQVTYLVPA